MQEKGTFPNRIRALLKVKPSEFARQFEVSRQAVQFWMDGRTVPNHYIIKDVLAFLGVKTWGDVWEHEPVKGEARKSFEVSKL